MSEQKPLSMEQGLAIQLYMEGLKSEYRPAVGSESYTDMDMEADDNGPWFRRELGGYGDWYQEIFLPHHRRRPDRQRERIVAGPGEAEWVARDANPVFTTTALADLEPGPDMPQVQRYRLITPHAALLVRAYKKEAREMLQELFKD